MLIESVAGLDPFERLVYWIKERESIRLKKEAGQPKPWTDDEILQKYRFCNVRRMDDRVSKWLVENWYVRNHPNAVTAVALARFINLPATLEHIPFPRRWNPSKVIKLLNEHRANGNSIFNSAYMVRGNDGVDKIESVVRYNVCPLHSLRHKIDPESMEATCNVLLTSYGIANFMAGQIGADLRWIIDGEWEDKTSWAPKGPGSQRGMNLLHCRRMRAPLPQAQFLDELRDLMAKLQSLLDPSITNRLEAIDYQNCLCEFSKYEKALWGIGKPKRRYSR